MVKTKKIDIKTHTIKNVRNLKKHEPWRIEEIILEERQETYSALRKIWLQ